MLSRVKESGLGHYRVKGQRYRVCGARYRKAFSEQRFPKKRRSFFIGQHKAIWANDPYGTRCSCIVRYGPRYTVSHWTVGTVTDYLYGRQLALCRSHSVPPTDYTKTQTESSFYLNIEPSLFVATALWSQMLSPENMVNEWRKGCENERPFISKDAFLKLLHV